MVAGKPIWHGMAWHGELVRVVGYMHDVRYSYMAYVGYLSAYLQKVPPFCLGHPYRWEQEHRIRSRLFLEGGKKINYKIKVSSSGSRRSIKTHPSNLLAMSLATLGILSIGDMGLGIAKLLVAHNYKVITNASGRR